MRSARAISKPPYDFVERFLGVLRVVRPNAQMDLCFAGRGKNGGVHFGITLVDAEDALLDVRFAQTRDPNFPVKHAHARGAALQPRQNLLAEERFQLARRSGEQRDEVSGVFQPQARRRAARILQNFRALGDHRLAHVDFRHFPVQRTEAPLNITKNVVVTTKLAMEQVSDRLSRKIVLGWSETARRNNQGHAIQSIAKCLAKQIAVVAHDRFSQHFDPNLVQLFRQKERIGVQPVRRKQLRTNCDDFRFHLFDYPRSGRPRTSQSNVKSAPVVARIARPDGCSAMPTSPEPLRATSAWPCGVMRTMPRRPPSEAAT